MRQFVFAALILLSPAARAQAQERPSPRIEVDLTARTASLEAEVIQNSGLLEALACGPEGRTHESLFLATVKPADLVAGLRALGLRPATEWARNERELFAVQGEKVLLWVEFEGGRAALAEDLVLDSYEHRPMRRLGWTFRARPAGEGLPEEVEFSLTFKGLRGAALSMLDSPYAYRPFTNVPLVGRREWLPDLEKDGAPLHPRVKIRIEPANEERITELALEQEGAPKAAEREPFLAAARRIDALKAAYAREVLPLLAAGHPATEEAQAFAGARIDAAVFEIEAAGYELDLLHERRELAALEASSEPDPRVLEAKRWVIGIYEVYRQGALAELEAARASLQALELRRAGGPEKEIRRAELTRELYQARVRGLGKKPALDDAKEQLRLAGTENMKKHFAQLVEVLETEVRIAQDEARKAEIELELLDLPARIEKSKRFVALYELEQELGKLRRDLRFYTESTVQDEAKAAEIRTRMEELEGKIRQLRAEVDDG